MENTRVITSRELPMVSEPPAEGLVPSPSGKGSSVKDAGM